MKKDKSTLCIIETGNTANVKILFNKITGLHWIKLVVLQL